MAAGLEEWLRSWMGLDEDIPPGERLVECFRPFIESLAASGKSHRTIQEHVDNIWALGGQFNMVISSSRAAFQDFFAVETHLMAEYNVPQFVRTCESLNSQRALGRNYDAGMWSRQAGTKQAIERPK
jgi:hypothetical protein